MTAAISSLNTLELHPFNAPDLSGREARASQSLLLAAVSEVSKDITLYTSEGDTVTLSMDRETVTVYGRNARMATDQLTAVNADGEGVTRERMAAETQEWFGFEFSQEITLTVEGDLSREEIRDIRNALRRIDRLIGKAFEPEAAGPRGHRSGGLARLGTLAGIEVDVRRSKTILAVQTSTLSTLTYGTDGQTAESPLQPREPTLPGWQTAADETAGIVEETGIDPEHFVDPLRDLFSHWSRNMRPRRSPFHPMLKMMESRVMDHLKSLQENDWCP